MAVVNMGNFIIMQYVHNTQADDNIYWMQMPEEQSKVSTRPDHLGYDIENNRWAMKKSENCKHWGQMTKYILISMTVSG